MPRRKQEFVEERRRQIIEGALDVFSMKGFVRATNKDVAVAAGINSPGLIYHYFKDKADLLRAVIEQHAPPMHLVAHPEEMMDLPPAEALTRFGLAYLRLTDDPKIGACIRLVFGEALREPAFARTFFDAGPLRVWYLLVEYLQHQMDLGRLRHVDPETAARGFLGPLVLQLLIRTMLRLPYATEVAPEDLVTSAVDIFLNGLREEAQ
jgi:AcrR family transcriptional regulator